jgi:tRNA (guanine37-N1)-methyltransferase
MKVTILSLFPEIVESYLQSSITKRVVDKGLLQCVNRNIRDYTTDRHKTCDDHPFGGGAGMVLKIEPLARAIEASISPSSYVVFPSPSGKVFDQAKALELSQKEDLVLIAGRYEGIDQRVIDRYVDEELTIGDYVMASGELSCMVVLDCVMRLLEGAIRSESLNEESFSGGLLEYPQYTRPEQFDGMAVPEILLSGHHRKIREWRWQKRVEKTLANRPEIMYNSKTIEDKGKE